MRSTEWQEIKKAFATALDLPDAKRADFLATCESKVREEVEKLLVANDDARGFIVEPAFLDAGFPTENDDDDPILGRMIGDYRIVREIGHGGMGTVYLARHSDESFIKEAAVKLVKRGMDTNAVLKRFAMERSILSQLEHPNIAGLIDGGTTPEGLPYFVMEYVDGLPVTKFCASRSINERLDLFQKICSAISYAHTNLVIHRDIKPSNILVTEDGTPKLLDFGIAKLLHPDWSLDSTEATATMFRVMTPEYASPEQIRGLPITTASDVYSLGVVLYELLTGERPYKIEGRLPEEIAEHILASEPVPPSVMLSSRPSISTAGTRRETADEGQTSPRSKIQVVKALRGDLDNIILKALRKEPERRYASVQEFSEDIRRHLSGLPVTATADTVSYRVSKFVRRHRAGVFAGVLIFLTLTTATAITSWQAVVANRERDRAEKRFDQVRELANTVLFDYHDGVANLAGSTPLRERMVGDALKYLDTLAADNINDPLLQGELATAYFKVGEVQGVPTQASLGDYGGALESFKKSLAIRQRLHFEDSQNDVTKLDLARSYRMVGTLSQATDNVPAALENFQKAFAIFDSMPLQSVEAIRELATLHTRFAAALSASGDHPKAVETFRRAVSILSELLSSQPSNSDLKRDLGIAYSLLGDAHEEAGDMNESLAAQQTAFATLEPLVIETNAQSKRDANSAHGRIGDALFKLGKYREALAVQLKVLVVSEALLRADPSNARARRDVQVDYYKIARNQSELGDMKAALISQQKCIDLCEAAVSANPESSEARGDLGVALYYFGAMHEKNGSLQAALENYKKATAIEEAMSDADPTNMSALSVLSEDYLKVGDLAMKLGNRAEALAGYLKALSMREKIRSLAQESGEDRAVSAEIYQSLGDYYFSQAKIDKSIESFSEAKTRYEQSLAVWNEMQQAGKLLAEDAHKPKNLKRKIERCIAGAR
ncbi:MAG TPA: protein kinase [Pyrinomonadaceae bacterium]|nr:protein kinase [Pyrinomonadaceae bacterium]